MGVKQLFRWFTGADQPEDETSFYRSIYPESVRYALRYNGAVMGKSEMRDLVNRWQFETVYLLAKGLIFSREFQRRFLEDLTRLYYRPDWTTEELVELLTYYIELLPDDVRVNGTKLAQLSRSGSDTWQDEWFHLADSLHHERPDALPCIVAHTPIFAYHQFIKVYRENKHQKIILLMPDWLMDPDETQMGYEISLGHVPTVQFQVKDECLFGSWLCEGVDCKLQQRFCRDAFFIDDTINTSKTADKLQSFWLTKYGLQVPIDRVRVITDLRDKHKEHAN